MGTRTPINSGATGTVSLDNINCFIQKNAYNLYLILSSQIIINYILIMIGKYVLIIFSTSSSES